MVIDTKTAYFVNKSDFQYKIIVICGRDIDLFRRNCRSVLKNHKNLGKMKISTTFRLKSAYDSIRVISLHLAKENNKNDLPFCQRNIPVERCVKLMT